jgi:hypothetical protein
MEVLDIATLYNKFQNDVGQLLDANLDQLINALFAESFRKTANGTPLVARRSDLKDQLLAVREQAGKWTIDVKEIMEFRNAQRCLIRYHLNSANLGTFDIMATLRVNPSGLIEEIDEVYYQVP